MRPSALSLLPRLDDIAHREQTRAEGPAVQRKFNLNRAVFGIGIIACFCQACLTVPLRQGLESIFLDKIMPEVFLDLHIHVRKIQYLTCTIRGLGELHGD